MKIIFMGTCRFAVPILEKLILNKAFRVVSIFTAPPKPTGRGLEVVSSPVAQVASKYSINTHTPKTLKSADSYDLLNSIEADIIVVASYGLIIPQKILDIKKFGCLNVHPSLLPKYRGAAPLQWTIINGDRQTGVCIMQMDDGIDTGDILLQKKISLPIDISFTLLHNLSADLGANLLIEALEKLPSLKKIKQSEEGLIYARKLTKEDGLISWSEKAYTIDCKIRGMNPWPGSYFMYNIVNSEDKLKSVNYKKIIKVLEATYVVEPHVFKVGTIINDSFTIACLDGYIQIKKLQLEGKKPMTLKEFLNGNNIIPGVILN